MNTYYVEIYKDNICERVMLLRFKIDSTPIDSVHEAVDTALEYIEDKTTKYIVKARLYGESNGEDSGIKPPYRKLF